MFRNVPACSGMFHVPGFIDGPFRSREWCSTMTNLQNFLEHSDQADLYCTLYLYIDRTAFFILGGFFFCDIVVGSLWLVVGHCGSLWDRCGSLWLVVARCGSLWLVVGRCGSLWVVVGRCGSLWVVVGRSGF